MIVILVFWLFFHALTDLSHLDCSYQFLFERRSRVFVDYHDRSTCYILFTHVMALVLILWVLDCPPPQFLPRKRLGFVIVGCLSERYLSK